MSPPEEARERPFQPDITVAVVIPRDGRLLFVEERVRGASVLNQPAGHLEEGESLAQAAVRETLEESGWEVALRDFVGMYRWVAPDGTTFVRVVFSGEPLNFDPGRPLDAGIERTLWLTPAELRAESHRARSPLVLAAVDDWLAGVRLPLSAVREMG
jgi:8-oxo-dGTP pyrophosphatase MutT (NUDIX family)